MTFQIAIGCNVRKSPFFDATVEDGVKSFSVYNHVFAPAHFGDPEGEYQALLDKVVMWDVSCERQVELAGPDAEQLMRYLTPRDIAGTAIGQGRYVPMCDYEGNLINDPVLQKLADDWKVCPNTGHARDHTTPYLDCCFHQLHPRPRHSLLPVSKLRRPNSSTC